MGEIMLWINRVGIIFNFVASFMIAPELIGLNRLKKLQKLLNDTLDENESRIDRIRTQISEWFKRHSLSILYFFIFSIVSFIIAYPVYLVVYYLGKNLSAARITGGIVWLIVFITTFSFATYISVALANAQQLAVSIDYENPSRLEFTMTAGRFLKYTIAVLLSPLLVPGYFVFLSLLRLFGNINYWVIRKLGGDRLRSIIVATGIFLFVMGNLFQFIATF